MASAITFTPAGGSPTGPIPALVEHADVDALVGGQLVEQALLSFTVRKADLPAQPRRGGSTSWAGRSWFVSEPGWSDEEDQTWTFKAARRA
jgi:hypothetical protein